MLLTVNLIQSNRFADIFDDSILLAAQSTGISVEPVRPGGIPDPRELEGFTHLLISGSEASVLENQPWDLPLASLVKAWAKTGKPALGICYGHQFLAKILLGPRHLRRAKEPEVGFKRTEIKNHPLFEGIDCPVFFYFHQDEVFDLPAALPVLASTDQCPVQAVRFGSDPIFGVQFHPEFNDLQAEEILAAATMRDLGPTVRVRRDLNDSTKSIQNRNLIVNFLRMNRNQ